MSQMPEMPAAGWAEQGYDPSAYPPRAEAQPAQSAGGWQQDTEPDWGASQQGYPESEYPGQTYQQQAYPEQGYPQAQAYPAFPTPAAEAESATGLPTEFDHLFRDSTPDSRRAIDRQKPMVGGAVMPEQSQTQYQAYQQQPQPPFPQQEEQYNPYPGQYQGDQYQPTQLQNGQYPQGQQAGYPQGGGYGEPGNGFGGGDGGGGQFGGGNGAPGSRSRNRKTLIIGGLVAVVAVVAIVLATSHGSPSGSNSATSGGTPTASPSKASPKQQADLIYQLIQQSGQLRSDANTAVVDVNGCKNLTDAQNMLSSTAQKRQAQADSVGKLDVSGIQNGAQLVSQLKAAWTASAQYDNAYAQIAGDVQSGCKSADVRNDSNQTAAKQAATTADNAKSQAARLWNDNVATSLGESQVSSDKL